MFCIAGVCSSGVFSGGVVGSSAFERATPSSRTEGKDLSGLHIQKSLVATLSRDDGTPSSRTAGRELSGLHIQRSLVAALSRDDGKVVGVINKQHEYGRIVEIAEREIGVMEKGCQNCGTGVAGYLNYVGIKTPAPWCAAWVSWVYGQAGYRQPKTAWSPALFPKERIVEIASLKQVQHRLMPRNDVEGLIMGIYFPELKRIAHCGIVAGLKGEYVQTIEGNTNEMGGREGLGVFRKLRHRRSIAKYADWIRPVPP